MASSIINSDDGGVSGITGLKTTGGDDGELAFEASGTEAMRIDSSGNVGIGTSSPTALLHVQGTNSGILVDTSTAYTPVIKASGALSDLKLSSVGNGGHLVLDAPGTTSVMTMSTNGSERMRIDSAGRVTKPYQPSFMAIRTSGYTGTGAQTIIYNSVNHNVGSHYNSSTGIFTAPVNGIYLVNTAALIENTSTHGDMQILINGVLSANLRKAYNENDKAVATILFNLSANDTVSVYKISGFDVYGSGAWTWFSVNLLG